MTERIARSDAWRLDFIVRHGARCHYCNRTSGVDQGPDDRPWWVDHMDPLARGGLDDEENLVLACKRCNLTKGVRPYKQFREFARLAFWVPDDWRASEGDLDSLIVAYERCAGGRPWEVSRDLRAIVQYEENDGVLATVVGLGEYTEISTLDFIVRAYEVIPALIAEIRMHRGEVGDGRPG